MKTSIHTFSVILRTAPTVYEIKYKPYWYYGYYWFQEKDEFSLTNPEISRVEAK